MKKPQDKTEPPPYVWLKERLSAARTKGQARLEKRGGAGGAGLGGRGWGSGGSEGLRAAQSAAQSEGWLSVMQIVREIRLPVAVVGMDATAAAN